MKFEQLNLIQPLLRAVRDEGYEEPTPVQEMAIPEILKGKDILGCAQTGTGKTAAFALPILQNLQKNEKQGKGTRPIRVLVLAPTRELANQVGESFSTYGRHTDLRQTTIFGGVRQKPQVDDLRWGVDIVVATPGRLLDLMNQGHVNLKNLEVFVLDEADRMLDMGFIPDIRRIVRRIPKKRQTLLFSATIPPDIRRLADRMLDKPVEISVAPSGTPPSEIDQRVYLVDKRDKTDLLIHLLDKHEISRALVFTRTRYGADKVARKLKQARLNARAIHGDKTQGQRESTLREFREGHLHVLVATDVASRGLDIDDISHVVNYDIPEDSESYVHRIGRTARAGASGQAIAFCSMEERENLLDIERLIHDRIWEEKDHPFRPGDKKPVPPRERAESGSGNGRDRQQPEGDRRKPRRRRRGGRRRHSVPKSDQSGRDTQRAAKPAREARASR
jgi:ATP-dependent RNA helicase RhlE